MTIDYSEAIKDGWVSSTLYANDEVFNDEIEKIFTKGWVYVAHDSEVPNVGDYVRRNIGLESFVVVRAKDKTVKVISNRCTHRSTLLVQEDKGNLRGSLTCWYHGWVFGFDGKLLSVPYEKGSEGLDHKCLPVARSESYGGFIFATLNDDAIPFDEYLGRGKQIIDRVLACSPTGKIRVDTGWVKYETKTNWKLQLENNVDGYHLNYVHAALGRAVDVRYKDTVMVSEDKLTTEAVDHQSGHIELTIGAGYTSPLEWLGVREGRELPEDIKQYKEDIEELHSEETAHEVIYAGPPHAYIFPNLFIAETNVIFYQMDNRHTNVQLSSPILFDGYSDKINSRFLRLCEGSLGPSSFLLPDDGAITERQTLGHLGQPMDIDLRRGQDREVVGEDGVIVSHITDETSQRAFWNHYKKVMTS